MGSLNDMDIASMGPNGKACFGLRRCESGVRWWVVMLKQCQIELIKGYLAPHKYMY